MDELWNSSKPAGSITKLLEGSKASPFQLQSWGSLPPDKWPSAWFTYNEKRYPRLPVIALNEIPTPSSNLLELMAQRSSHRLAGSASLNVKDLSSILRIAIGAEETRGLRRHYSSAGARNGVEVYVLAHRVDGLPSGVYSYNHALASLYAVREGISHETLRMIFGEEWIASSQLILVLTCAVDRLTIKYADRGFRYALLEAGAVAQNITLASTDLGFGSCLVGGFADDMLSQLILTTPQTEFPILSCVINAMSNERKNTDE